MAELSYMRIKLEQRKGRRQQIQNDKEVLEKEVEKYRSEIKYSEEAQAIIQQVSRITQDQLRYHISELVSLAMKSIFANPYELNVQFVVRRGKTEADLSFVRDGDEIFDPVNNTSGGAVDVASLALQLSLWTLQTPRSLNTIFLDEPLKWLKGGDLPERGAMLIREISRELGLQIIMISHNPKLIENADRIFEVQKTKGISIVKTIEGE